MVDSVYEVLQEVMALDKYTVPFLSRDEASPGVIAKEYVSMNRPLIVKGYATQWDAVKKWFSQEDPHLLYLKNKVGNSSIKASQIRKIMVDG